MKARCVLDSYAVLTYLKEEPGWQKVRCALWAAMRRQTALYLSSVNLGEIYYIVYRENGPALADQALALIKLWPVNVVPADSSLALIAGRMKAENRISYADAYVVATALKKKAVILTGDREFKEVEDFLKVDWLPKNK
jgi:predicted nucleic acid-binding protein